MFGFGIIEAAHEVCRAIGEEREFSDLCKTLPPEVAEKLKEDRRQKRAAEIEHARALEVADAGRARNFWGK